MTASAAASPTGHQYEIAAGGYRAVITEQGATLRLLQVEGRDILAGFGPGDRVSGGHGQQLMPWSNRIRDGRYSFDGQDHQLPINEVARGTALHGLVRWVGWELVHHTEDTVSQRVLVFPQQGWDSTIECTVTHELSGSGLTVTVDCENVGDRAVPFGYAAHPYFTLGEERVDDLQVTVPAASYLEVDPQRLLPIAVRPVDGRPEDLRSPEPLGDRVFDTAFTDLDTAGRDHWQVRLAFGDRETVIWADRQHQWIQLYTGADRRDLGLAVEPMTCGPDAFNTEATATGLVTLQPGDRYRGRWGVRGR